MSDSLSDYTDYGILQARRLEWVAIPFSRDFPDPRIEPGLLHCKWFLYQLSYQGSPLILNSDLNLL